MNKIGHTIGGLSAGIIVINQLSQKNGIDGVLLSTPYLYTVATVSIIEISAYFGSLFPDIDHPESTIGKKLKTTSRTLKSYYGHRGITHLPLFLVWVSMMMCGIYYILTPSIGIWWKYICYGFLAGWVSHIILDCFNTAGIRLFAPISQKRYRLPTKILLKNKKDFRKNSKHSSEKTKKNKNQGYKTKKKQKKVEKPRKNQGQCGKTQRNQITKNNIRLGYRQSSAESDFFCFEISMLFILFSIFI